MTSAPTEVIPTLVYRVPSDTDEGTTYNVAYARGVAFCDCRGAAAARSRGRNCKHERKVIDMENEQNGTTAVATRDDAPPQALVVSVPSTALLPTRGDMKLMHDIAKTVMLAGEGMVPKYIKTPYQALAVMLAGHELGLRPMTSLRHVYIVNGKTEIETRAMVGIVKARDPRIKFEWPEYTQEAVTCIVNRPGQTPVTCRYTVDDAKKSGQWKPGPWQQYTRDMLYAAATKRAVRLSCPDIINAIDSGMQHTVIEAESVAVDAESYEVPDAPALGEIPAEAFNEGDEGALSVEVEPPAPTPTTDVPDQIRKAMLALSSKIGSDANAFHAEMRERYSEAASGRSISISKLTPERQAELLADYVAKLPAEAPEQEATPA